MALKLDITSSTGLLINDAYVKVEEYSCAKNNTVNARLRGYVSKELSDNGASHIEGSEYIITLVVDYSDAADNTKKQIYTHAKTLENYVNAIDC